MPRQSEFLSFPLILSLLLASLAAAWAQTPAEIQVSHDFQYIYQDGKTTRTFQSLRLGLSKAVSFTVTNQGEQPLTGLALTVDGAHPEDYVITQGLALTELTGGVSTTFTLEFKPTANGIRTATLHIASNDADEAPFDIPLYGEGSTPEIRVVAPSGNEILQGGSYSYGNHQWSNEGVWRQFVIQNAGVGALKVSSTTSTGANAADFDIYYDLSDEVARPGADLGLTVIFNPSAYGPRTATITITSDDEDEGTFQFTVTATGFMAGFQAEQVENTPLTNNEIIQVGPVGYKVAGGKSVTLTLKNPGNRPLTLGALLTGTHAADFSIKSAPASTLQPGQSTTVTVSFVPKDLGARQAELRISHNATPSGQSTYLPLRLQGQGVFSMMEFDSWRYSAIHGQAHAVVKIRRSEASFPTTIKLETLAGTDQAIPPIKAAMPGVDYTPLSEAASLISFATGEVEKTVNVPLLTPASRARIHRHLRLELQEPGPGATLNPNGRYVAELRILGSDTIKPTLTLTTPAAGKVSTARPLPFVGTAGDTMGIDRVEVRVNGGDPVQAMLGEAKSNTSVPFTAGVPLPEGIHNIEVTAYDLRGNSTSVTRTIEYTYRRTLTLSLSHTYDEQRTGGGGTLSLTATPAAAATQFFENGYDRAVAVLPGTKLKITLKPKSGVVFSVWDYTTTAFLNSPTTVSLDSLQASRLGTELTLTMPDDDVQVRAGLMESFNPLPEETKNLYWLLTPDGQPTTPVSTMAGVAHLSGTLTASGAFSGKLLVNGQTVPVVASFYGAEAAAFTVAGKKRASQPVPGGALTIRGQQESFQATITPTDTNLPPMHSPSKRGLSSVAKGYYTLPLVPGYPESTSTPGAPSYATLNLTSTGIITLAGVLADGIAITQSTALLNSPENSSNAEVYTFVQLPTPGGTTRHGLIYGTSRLFAWDDVSYFNTVLFWHRPAAASPKILLYPAGWPTGISLNGNGPRYSPSVTAQAMFFPNAPANTVSPAFLTFTGGKLVSDITKENFGLKGNSVVKTAPADASYTLTISPSTGVFSGTFTPNWSNPSPAKPIFKGIITQGDQKLGFFINNAKGETAPESGTVLLGGQ